MFQPHLCNRIAICGLLQLKYPSTPSLSNCFHPVGKCHQYMHRHWRHPHFHFKLLLDCFLHHLLHHLHFINHIKNRCNNTLRNYRITFISIDCILEEKAIMHTSSILEFVSTGCHQQFKRFQSCRPISLYFQNAPTLQCLPAKETIKLVEKKFNRYTLHTCISPWFQN